MDIVKMLTIVVVLVLNLISNNVLAAEKGFSSKSNTTNASNPINLNSTQNINIIDQILGDNNKSKKVILMIWDGLRPDVITKENTPVLFQLKNSGTFFADHHSSFPTVTMNNANSLATGHYAGDTGFFGNKIWRPDILGTQPISVQEEDVLTDLDKPAEGKPLLYVETLLQVAERKGLKTVQMGKDAPAILQNIKPNNQNIILTETKIHPMSFLNSLKKKGYILPKRYYSSVERLPKDNDSIFKKNTQVNIKTLDGKMPLQDNADPNTATEGNYKNANEYLMALYVREILTNFKPDLSVMWFNEPDSTAHTYGIGTKAYYNALRNQDRLLGSLIYSLNKMGLADLTNLIIVSDHGYSTVSADYNTFPLRDLRNKQIGEISKNGYSASGSVRIVELLKKAGFKAYDGKGCVFNPTLVGMFQDRSLLADIKTDQDGKICNKGKGVLYNSANYFVPQKKEPGDIIVAGNNGSAFLYVVDKDEKTVKNAVKLLQSRVEFDSIFVDPSYGDIPGTMSMQTIRYFDQVQGRNPDILVSMSYDTNQSINGLPGIAYSASDLGRGSHGSLSPFDIKATLIAYGPDFKKEYTNNLPSANVDVPVTIANLLKLPLNNRVGRPLLETLVDSGVKASDYTLKYNKLQPNKPAVDLNMPRMESKNQKEYYTDKENYTFVLDTKELSLDGLVYHYIDSGKAIRY